MFVCLLNFFCYNFFCIFVRNKSKITNKQILKS